MAFGGYFVSSSLMLRQFVRQWGIGGTELAPGSISRLAAALFCSVFFASLLRRTNDNLERFTLVLSALYFVLWGAEIASGLGLPWVRISHNLALSLAICMIATVTVAIRTIQIALQARSRPE